MKRAIVFGCILLCLGTAAQNGDMRQLSKAIDKSAAEAKQQMAQVDSLSKSINDMMTRRYDSMQKAQIAREAERSGQLMLQWHNERQAKARRKMFIYLALGIGFLGLLVFGLLRKRKPTKR
jgi:Tfp pilus assembly protein PilN